MEMFEGATFFFDTNVIIPALEPADGRYAVVEALFESFQGLGAELKVCPVTLEELEVWLAHQHQLLNQILSEIPESATSHVESPFVRRYEIEVEQGRHPSVDDLFEGFADPRSELEDRYGIVVDSECTYDLRSVDSRLVELSKLLQRRSLAMSGRPKRGDTALHDAALLSWVQHLRAKMGKRDWFVTFDRTLPGAIPCGAQASTVAVTVGALLQWLSPLAGSKAHSGNFTAGFVQMVRDRVLPSERFFQLNDFLLLQDLHGSTKELPTEDVEAAIHYMKQEAPNHDLSSPAGREKLSHGVAQFLVDHGRRYKQEVTRLESEKDDIKRQLETERAEAEAARSAAIALHNKQIQGLQAAHNKLEQKAATDRLAHEGKFRVLIVTIFACFYLGIVAFLARQFGDGSNFYQQLLNSMEFFILVIPLTITLSWFVVGRERLIALGGPFPKLLKVNN